MIEKDEEQYKSDFLVDFARKNIESDKVGDQCKLTGKYQAPAYNNCNKNSTQK